MNKKYNIILLLFVTITIFAQETKKQKAPKQYSFEAGYRNIFSVIDNSNVIGQPTASNGYGFLFDYAWQLSGFNNSKSASFITIPMGYTIMPSNNPSISKITMLNYGWTTRHEIGRNKKWTPFLGYGLLLNTLKVDGTLGSVMGHQTQFEFGMNLKTNTRLKYFAKIQYSYTSYPKLEDDNRIHYQFADLRVGVRF